MENLEAQIVVGGWTFGKAKRKTLPEIFPGIEAVRVVIERSFDRTIGTSLSDHEMLALTAIVQHSGAKNILEIGTFDGNTTLNIAANTPDEAKITTVDLPPDWDGELDIDIPEFWQNVTPRHRVGQQFQTTLYAHKITQVFEDSATVDYGALPLPLDLVFIDGCHHYDYVKTDTTNALKHLRPGGLIIWHDYGMIEDVSKVVDETARQMEIYAIRGTRLAVGFVE